MAEQTNTKASKPTAKRERTYLEVGVTAHQQVRKESKRLKVSSIDYVTAAVAYFAERGLDPTGDVQREGVQNLRRADEHRQALEQQIKSLGDRLFGFLTQHERNLYGFLQGQQRADFVFMQNQQASLFNYLLSHEQHIMTPLISALLQTADDAFVSRRLGEQIVLRQQDAIVKFPERHAENTKSRDERVAKALEKFATDNPMPLPVATPAPSLTSAPLRQPSQSSQSQPGVGRTSSSEPGGSTEPTKSTY